MNPLGRYPVLASLLSPFRRSQQKTCAILVSALCQADALQRLFSNAKVLRVDFVKQRVRIGSRQTSPDLVYHFRLNF